MNRSSQVEALRAWAEVDPLAQRELEDPSIPPEVYYFMKDHLAELGMTWDGVYTVPNQLSMEQARSLINRFREVRGLSPLTA